MCMYGHQNTNTCTSIQPCNVRPPLLPCRSLASLSFSGVLSPHNVQRVVTEAEGYSPAIIFPEKGVRRLLADALALFRGPAA